MIRPVIPDNVIERLRALINGVRNVVITCHLSPDGDAIGSSLALCHILHRLGKNAIIVTPDMVPKSLTFLPDIRNVVVYSKTELRARYMVEHAQLFFCLDFNDMHRIDKLGEIILLNSAPKILIDHHLNPSSNFDLMISYPDMSSTCELLFRVLMQLRMLNMIDHNAAQCLLAGMMTDTGNFTYGCNDPEIYEIQASLMRRHIDRQWLYNKAMNTFSADSIRLQGYAMSEKMQLFPDKHAALLTLTQEELKRFNYRKGDTEGLVNKPLSIPGIDWVVFFRQDPEYVKVSCRSRGDFSVNEICNKYFNGGGHLNAAGGEFYGTIEQAEEVFKNLLEEINFTEE